MTVFLMLAMAGAAIAAIGYPLFRRPDVDVSSETERDDLVRDKERVLKDIRDLEFDLQTGKLSDVDYADLRLDYETEAVAGLKAIEKEGNGMATAVRRENAAAFGVDGEAEPRFCTQCGAAGDPGDRFCRACGSRLRGSTEHATVVRSRRGRGTVGGGRRR